MGNCTGRLRVAAREQVTISGVGTQAITGETSSFHTAVEECFPSGHGAALGDHSDAGSSREQRSEYFSARVEEMMRSRSQFSSDAEHEIAHSKVHWSELQVPGLSELSEDSDHEEEDNHLQEEVDRENREVFAELMNDPQWKHHERGPFFHEWPPVWKLGRKIAEGGQAAIFEVLNEDGSIFSNWLLKVFKRGLRLSDLKKQWPHGILRGELKGCLAFKGLMLNDGRFAFLLARCWGDLRKLIDQAMEEKNYQGPPFLYELNGETYDVPVILLTIATYIKRLHKQGILHRDLKAANILIALENGGRGLVVADYECSIGVIGTGFWRSPEILLALKDRRAIDFTEAMDVSSFGMVCFEVIIGRLPFEGELEDCRASQDLVIGGQRPKLPSDLDVRWKTLIERCWNPIPNERPSFEEIVYAFKFRTQ